MKNYIWPKITKDTPIEEVKKIHQQIWDYVIEHGEKPMTPYASDCAACEYDELYEGRCRSCPIVWPADDDDEGRCCNIPLDDDAPENWWTRPVSGLYGRWDRSTGEERTELARQIRDLPWKFETEENTPL